MADPTPFLNVLTIVGAGAITALMVAGCMFGIGLMVVTAVRNFRNG